MLASITVDEKFYIIYFIKVKFRAKPYALKDLISLKMPSGTHVKHI